MSGSGGPWGGGKGGGDEPPQGERPRDGDKRGPRGGREGPQIPEIDEIMKKGQERLRVLMGGRSRQGGGGGGGGGGPVGPVLSRNGILIGLAGAVALWAWASFYTVRPEERSVELFLGDFSSIGNPGLNFAPWPLVTAEIVQVTGERTTDIGTATGQTADGGLMLTRDQNIVDIGFQVVWNISDPSGYLFNLAEPDDTIRAVSESVMRDIIARSELSPILNRDRGLITADLQRAVQTTLDSYNAGITVIRVNLQRAQPPEQVIDAFREVQAAQQERERLQNEADAYANRVTAGARGEAARLVEEAEAYRAQVVNNAEGEASRFVSVYNEYVKAPEVTRRRMYIETMERVFGDMNKVILDGVGEGGQGVVPFLPLNELGRPPVAPLRRRRHRYHGSEQLMSRTALLLSVAGVAIVAVMSSLFIVDERKKALVLQFGQVRQVVEEPGLGFKIPLIQEVVRYDDRILGLQTQAVEVTMLDDRRLVVDAFARWRISDVVRFRQAVGQLGEAQGLRRLEGIINPAIQEVLGSVNSNRVLSEDRGALMNQIRDIARRQAAALGIEVIDLRLTRTDLPDQNLSATFARMRAEREREAADEVARGNEAALRVRAAADRTVVELTSEARKNAEIVRGEADAARNAIYADAFGRDPEFFAFTRSLTSYERALKGANSSIVMQPDSAFFEYLRSYDRPTPPVPPAAPTP